MRDLRRYSFTDASISSLPGLDTRQTSREKNLNMHALVIVKGRDNSHLLPVPYPCNVTYLD